MTTLSDVEHAARNIVEKFRLGIEGAGSESLEKFMVVLEYALKNARFSDFNESRDLQLLITIVQAMERGDFVYIADLLEYELPQARIWEAVNSVFGDGKKVDIDFFPK